VTWGCGSSDGGAHRGHPAAGGDAAAKPGHRTASGRLQACAPRPTNTNDPRADPGPG